jgi:phosphinothricin acetyltransferase
MRPHAPEETAVHIRDAEIADLETIADIYNDAVVNTTAIWNETVVDVDDRAVWMAERLRGGYPVIVAADDSEVLGYATFGPWRPHDGYRHTVEHSVYERGDQRGRGIGKALMLELIARARTNGTHVMIAAVESENQGSIALHERLGFVQTGRLPQVGAKFGRWLDLTFLQLNLDDRPTPA